MTDAKTRQANRERQRRYREAHRDEINEQRKERYNNRIAKGKCPRCGGKAKSGYTLCASCCDYQANLNRKYAKQKKGTVSKATAARAAKKASKTVVKKAVKKPAKKTTVKKPIAKKTTAKAAVKKPAAKKKQSKAKAKK